MAERYPTTTFDADSSISHNLDLSEEDEDLSFVSIYYSHGKLAAAYYLADSGTLKVLEDVQDLGPDLRLTKLLLKYPVITLYYKLYVIPNFFVGKHAHAIC